jgi:hypothetical protein
MIIFPSIGATSPSRDHLPEPVVIGAAWPKAGPSPMAGIFLSCARKALPGK